MTDLLDPQKGTSAKQLPGGYRNATPIDYRKCVRIHQNKDDRISFFSQSGIAEAMQPWDTGKMGTCLLYVTAGPQANETYKVDKSGRKNTMARTYDENSGTDINDFFQKITMAYLASFEAMNRDGCEVAIVPGLSSGLYAPVGEAEGAATSGDEARLARHRHLSRIQRVIPFLIHDAYKLFVTIHSERQEVPISSNCGCFCPCLLSESMPLEGGDTAGPEPISLKSVIYCH